MLVGSLTSRSSNRRVRRVRYGREAAWRPSRQPSVCTVHRAHGPGIDETVSSTTARELLRTAYTPDHAVRRDDANYIRHRSSAGRLSTNRPGHCASCTSNVVYSTRREPCTSSTEGQSRTYGQRCTGGQPRQRGYPALRKRVACMPPGAAVYDKRQLRRRGASYRPAPTPRSTVGTGSDDGKKWGVAVDGAPGRRALQRHGGRPGGGAGGARGS